MAETDIELKVGLDNKDAVAKSKELQSEIQKVFNKNDGKKLDSSMQNLQNKMSGLTKKASELQGQMKELENTKIPTDDYKEVNDWMQKTQDSLTKVQEKMDKFIETGGDTKSTVFKKMQYDAAELENTIEYAKGELKELVETGKDFKLGSDTDAYATLESQLTDVNNQMEVSLAKSKDLDGTFRRMAGSFSGGGVFGNIVNKIGQMGNALQNMGAVGGEATAEIGAGMSSVASTAMTAVPIVGGVTAAIVALGKVCKKVFDFVYKNLKQFFDAEAKLTAELANSIPVLRRVSQAIGLALHPKEMVASVKNLLGQITNILKNGVSSVSNLVSKGLNAITSKMRSAITSGINSLEQWRLKMGQTTNSITALKNSLSTLNANIGAAFAPILDAVSPILTKLIALLNQAAASVASFFAAFGGKSKVAIAKTSAGMTKYANTSSRVRKAGTQANNTVEETGNTMARAGKKTEQANKQLENFLGSYDELNVLGKEDPLELDDILPDIDDALDELDDIGGGGSGGGAGVSVDVEFEEIDIDQNIKDLVDRIKSTWEQNANFEWLGELLADKLKGAFDKVYDWINGTGKPFVEKLGSAIADILNGFFRKGNENGLAKVLGDSIVAFINMVLGGLETLIDKVDASEAGKFIETVISRFLSGEEADELWRHLSGIICGGINKAIGFIKELLNPEKGLLKSVGDRLGTLLEECVEGINTYGLGEAFADVIDGAAKLIEGILKNRQTFWKLGIRLGELLNGIEDTMAANGTWQTLGKDLGYGINDAFAIAGGFLSTWNNTKLAAGISDMVNNTVSTIEWQSNSVIFSQMLIRLFDTLAKTAEGIDPTALGQGIADAIEGIDVEGMVSSFLALSHSIVLKIGQTLLTALTQLRSDGTFARFGMELGDGLASQDWSDVFSTFGEVLKNALGGIVEFIGGFLLTKVENMPIIGQIFGPKIQEIREKMQEAKEAMVEKAMEMPNAVEPPLEETGDVICGELQDAATTGSEIVGTLKDAVTQSVTDMKGDVVEQATELKTQGEEQFNALKQAIVGDDSGSGGILGTMRTAAQTAVEGMKTDAVGADGLTGGFGTLKTNSVDLFNTMQQEVATTDGTGGAFGNMRAGAKTATDNMNTETTTNAQAMSTNATQAATNMQTQVTTEAQTMSTNVQQATNDMSNTVAGSGGTIPVMTDNVTDDFSEMEKSVTGNKGHVPTIEKETTKSFDNINETLTTATDEVTQHVEDEFKDTRDQLVGAKGDGGYAKDMKKGMNNAFKNIKKKLDTIVPETTNMTETAFETLRNKLVGAGGGGGFANNMKKGMVDAFSGMQSGIKGKLNGILSNMQAFCDNMITSINGLIDALNALADAQANGGGEHVPSITIPQLAAGAVIPPNRPFLAMLGDQKSGTNIEAPLSTIQEAVASVMEPYLAEIAANTKKTADKDLTVRIGDRDVARSAIRGQRNMGLQLRTS